MSSHREDIRVQDRVDLALRGGDDRKGGFPGRGAPPIRVYQNIDVTLREEPNGPVVERRKKHNIFLNYGREWISELVALDVADGYFRTDRIKYMAFGIGGTRQRISSDVIRSTAASGYGYTGFPDDWGTPSGTTGSGSGDPAQTDVDPDVTGLEYPVEVTSLDYYDDISQPATFPQAGIVRFTSIVGYNEISIGTRTSVPISEVGLFTQAAINNGLDDAPLPSPPVRYMVAYNTFDTLSKTTAYVLQVDWELRFS